MKKRFSLSKRLSWRVEFSGYRLMEGLLMPLPLSLIDRLGSGLGFLFYYLSPRYRRLATRNLRIALGDEKEAPEIHRLARATCQRTIANFLGTLKTTILPTEKISEHVELEGLDHLLAALAEGKGAILVLGHMGNWEILNRLHQYLPPETPAGGIYQKLKNPLVNAHLLERREQDGSKLFEKKKGFHAPATFVKEGGLLIVVADQKASRAGIPIPFFDRLSTLSPLPSLLAKKAGSPVLAAGIETISAGKWRVVLKPLPEKPATEDIITALEALIRRSPADYLWLHDRWRIDGLLPLSLSSHKFKKSHPETKPLRILILSEERPEPRILTDYLAKRDPGDIPLSFEHLFITNNPIEQNTRPDTLEAPSRNQLAARIQRIDRAKDAPLELALLLKPNEEWQAALAQAKIPKSVVKDPALSLAQFLETLTALTS